LRLPGRFNVANAVLAVALLDAVGVPADTAVAGLADTVVPGRMEPVDAGQPFVAVVDYAHTPDAVATALAALRQATPGRLLTVLGCGGDRDAGKRPEMGRVAAEGSDVLIVTDDNPRSEDPAAIRAAVLAGAREVPAERRAEVAEEGDRRAAIAEAVRAARPGDAVLVAGKGHETGQEAGGRVTPFDDRAVLREVLAELVRS
jgi:UDP-N-acetylmuramoyl-L-alanyl-D-glutamate--2,6-diaminopimelate ligase